MDLAIAGKRALVLGGSRGLGAASALALLAEGVDVHAVSRGGASPAPAIAGFGADLANPADVDRLVAHAATLGVDILVANSGGPPPGPAHGVAPDAWRAQFEAMAVALFRVADAVLPHMRAQGWGRIVTIGSSSIEQPIPGLAISNAVRGAVAGWSKTLAAEVAAEGITVNMVLPGRIDTDRVRALDAARAAATGQGEDAIRAEALRDIPAGRLGDPAEFGAVVAFLAGRPAAYVTGSMLRVDGGLIRAI